MTKTLTTVVPQFYLYQSNKLEILADKLVENLGRRPLPPLQQETIIVQSKGMQEYVSLLLARKIGICAHVTFPFPVLFTYKLFRDYFPSLPEDYPFAQEILFWKILDILPSFKEQPEARILKDYAPSNLELGHIQLAENLAYLFDQYVIFRPDMVLHWDQGKNDYFKDQQEHEAWQARLWQNISQGREQEHRAALKERFKQALKENPQKLPERISIFGISSLPLYYLDIFYTLAHFCPVHVYIHNPCQIYWGDNPGPKARTALKEDYQVNDLLVSWGKLGRDFLDSFYTFDLQINEWEEFLSHGRDTLLHCIQDDILINENPDPDKQLLSPDKSITIRSCHSPMREVEVLKDYIYYILENNPDIQPDDILVMTPDLELYAPYIQAVFDKTEDPNQKLPYTIAEKKLAHTEASQALIAILELLQSRFEASKVLSVLEKPIVHKKFSLTASDLELITHWIRQVHIFWGLNSEHKRDLDLPPHYQNTWEFGLHRLFLGLVLPGDNWTLFYRPDKAGPPILPYPEVEGEAAHALSSLAQFITLLHDLYTEIKKPHNIQQWEKILQHILDNFLAQDSESMENEDFSIQVLNLREQVLSLTSKAAKTAEFKGEISLPGLIHILKQHLSPKNIEYGYFNGSITFCSMLAMRSIPKKVICMLGLNDSAFPREDKRPNFDLIFARPQKGDRSIRNDDRYLFLEALLSARDYLFISFVGQSLEDNSETPPSVLVSELLDYVQKYYKFERQDARDCATGESINLVVKDRLQPFHPYYFSSHPAKNDYFSFSEENLAAATALTRPKNKHQFFTSYVPDEENPTRIDLHEFIRFWKHPVKFLARQRLGQHLEIDDGLNTDTEPLFELNGLDKYKLAQEVIARLLEDEKKTVQDLWPVLAARGIFPQKEQGKLVRDRFFQELKLFFYQLKRIFADNPRLAPRFLNLTLDNVSLSGKITSLHSKGLVFYRYASLKARDLLSAWTEHLFLSLSLEDYPGQCLVLGKDKNLTFGQVKEPENVLKGLVDFYKTGQSQPLKFIPEISFQLAEEILIKEKSEEEALASAKRKALGNKYRAGEFNNDEYYRLFFREEDLFDKEFVETSLKVFGPILWAKG